MKVCLRNALYPLSLQAGLYGLYTPVIVPRLGYCEYNAICAARSARRVRYPDFL